MTLKELLDNHVPSRRLAIFRARRDAIIAATIRHRAAQMEANKAINAAILERYGITE